MPKDKQVNAKVSDETYNALTTLESAHRLNSTADATRTVLECGLKELGFLSEGIGITPARHYAREIAKLLAYVAATLLVLSLAQGLQYFTPAIGVFGGSVAIVAVDRWVLSRVEPAVTNRIPRIEVSRRGPSQ